MLLVKFGDYEPPTPTEFSVDAQDIDSDDTGRGETGYMTRERVRADVYKLSVKFTNLTSLQVLNIKESIAPASISVQFFDGNYVTRPMFAGNRKLSLKSVDDASNCFWDMDFSLVEF